MYLKISSDRSVSLEDADDFKRFNILVDNPPPADWQTNGPFQVMAEDAGEGHHWLDADAVAKLSPRRDDDAWLTAYWNMLTGAERYGFYDSARRKIKAHVVFAE